jgi:hypothetical protein
MTYKLQLKSVSDDDLLHRLSELLRQSRRVESELVAHIGEVDERRLYAREAFPSMFAYSTEVLHLSEHEAYLRIAVARASRKHPMLLTMLGDGRLHLSGMVAELSPKPDVPAAMRKLPERPEKTKPTPAPQLVPDRVARRSGSRAREPAPVYASATP